MEGFPEIDTYDALGLGELVARGDVTPAALVEECIRRIESTNQVIRAVVLPLFERARDEAARHSSRGPFAGVPFLLKDLIQFLPGVPTAHGCRFLGDLKRPDETTLAKRFRESGLIVIGKAATSELGILPSTETLRHGPTHNPWDLSRTPGGSSGGSAAAVAARMVPLASAGDGGGSIRIPASCCGQFGLKPSRGRIPVGPYASQAWSGYVQELVVSRSVRDTAAILDVVSSYEPGSADAVFDLPGSALAALDAPPRKLRIAFHCEPFAPVDVHPDCVAAVQDAARLCEALGHEVVERAPQHPEGVVREFQRVISANVAREVRAYERELGREATAKDIEPTTWVSRKLGEQLSAADLLDAIEALDAETRRLVRRYADVDVVLSPTLAQPPIPLGTIQPHGLEGLAVNLLQKIDWGAPLSIVDPYEVAVRSVFSFVPFTPVANFTGQPSMSVPLFWSRAGLPIGVMFTGRVGDELLLLRLARELEEARPWFDRRPPHAYGAA
jgi:amidase